MTIAEEIKSAREKCGVTQNYCAKKLGIKQPSYFDLEHGITMPSFIQMVKLRGALKISLDEIADKYLTEMEEIS